jgi:phasin family protein
MPNEIESKAADVQKLVAGAATAGVAKTRKLIDQEIAQVSAAVETTMDKTTKTVEGMTKVAEDAAEFSRGNIEAFTKAAQVYFAGVQDLSKQAFALIQGLTEHSIEGAKALGQVKSLKEATDIQTHYARAAIEKSMAESAKLQEQTMKLVEASVAPLTARMTLAVEKFGKPLAA